MTTIQEGRVSWTFTPVRDWKVEKYDNLPFYRRQFANVAGGTKAVDVLALQRPGKVLWMIEAKDFTTERRDGTKPPLWLEVAQKARDTLAGVMAAACTECEDQPVARDFRKSEKLRVVLHLEQPSRPSKLFPRSYDPADLQQKLRSLLRAIDPHALVVDARNTNVPWSSSWTP